MLDGGRRDRAIWDNLFRLVVDSLTVLGWFDAGRQHAPISAVAEAVDEHDSIKLNTLAVVLDTSEATGAEIGSFAEIRSIDGWVDWYAEDDAIGLELISDVVGILKGKIAGRTAPVLEVVDFTLATPSVAFRCEITDVTWQKAHGWTQPNRKHWYSAPFTLVDEVD